MKAKKVVAGVVATLFLLTLSATGALALNDPCDSGNVTATGAGHKYVVGTAFAPALRSVTLTCDAAVGTWTSGERTFVIPGTPDKDGVYAAALTALVEGRKVKFVLSTPDAPVVGTTKGQIKLLHVLGQ